MSNKVKGFFADFKKFITRGNVLDMAVGVIVGGAFTAIVTALTNNILKPLINWLIAAISGGQGLEAYTFLRKTYDTSGNVDMSASIYIDWGAFISAIINFLLVAFILFSILKAIMSAEGFLQKSHKEHPTKEERKQLKAQGVNMKDHKEVIKATAELRAQNAPKPTEPKPTQEELLTQILIELKKQNKSQETLDNELVKNNDTQENK